MISREAFLFWLCIFGIIACLVAFQLLKQERARLDEVVTVEVIV